MTSYAVKISSNGQVSIPAPVRHRWKAARVLVIDKGDRIIVRPIPDDPVAAIVGKYAGIGPASDELRQISRDEDAEREDKR